VRRIGSSGSRSLHCGKNRNFLFYSRQLPTDFWSKK
jgi:hypothetical protein